MLINLLVWSSTRRAKYGNSLPTSSAPKTVQGSGLVFRGAPHGTFMESSTFPPRSETDRHESLDTPKRPEQYDHSADIPLEIRINKVTDESV
jgi:hypothetical protein